MLLGALVDLGADAASLEERLRRLPLPGLRLEVGEVVKNGIRARKVTPRFAGGGKPLRTLGQVREALRGGALEDAVLSRAKKVFQRLAEAEAAVHGKTAGTVHFHELGSPDTLVDVVGVLLAWNDLGIEEGYASAVNLGGGEVRTEHGILPVPAPATAELLKSWPVFTDGEEGEKTTPTGAVLVSHLCSPAAPLPPVRLARTGYGAGERDFAARPNCLQVLLGEKSAEVDKDEAMVVETNLDDVNPQVFGHLTALLLEAGAMDAYVTPVVMKKGRPGHLLTALVRPDDMERIGRLVFRETGTLGYRYRKVGRRKIRREIRQVTTVHGPVRVKIGIMDGEVVRSAPEYEDCLRIARASGQPLKDVMEEAVRELDREEPAS
jgi:uncharacterized protein (TIGR00299 family) protein